MVSGISSNNLLPFESFLRLVAVQLIILWSNMDFDMFCKIFLSSVSLSALVALEWFLSSVCLHVPLQINRRSASVVALVAFARLFFSMLPHHMNFQFRSFNAGKLTCCAPIRLFSRVSPLVQLQVACFCCFVIALIAMVMFFPGVHLLVRLQVA